MKIFVDENVQIYDISVHSMQLLCACLFYITYLLHSIVRPKLKLDHRFCIPVNDDCTKIGE